MEVGEDWRRFEKVGEGRGRLRGLEKVEKVEEVEKVHEVEKVGGGWIR